MTIDAAQIELLKALGGGATGSGAVGQGLASLLTQAGSSSGQSGLLNGMLPGAQSAIGSSPLLGSGLGGVLSSAASGSGGLTGGLLSLSPLLAGLSALFGGGSQQTLPEFTKYAAPDALSLSLGVSNGGQNLGTASYGQTGTSRLAPAITVNVNAIDSKSFSDHSEAIAQVVREAMLNSGALTDVMAEI